MLVTQHPETPNTAERFTAILSVEVTVEVDEGWEPVGHLWIHERETDRHGDRSRMEFTGAAIARHLHEVLTDVSNHDDTIAWRVTRVREKN